SRSVREVTPRPAEERGRGFGEEGNAKCKIQSAKGKMRRALLPFALCTLYFAFLFSPSPQPLSPEERGAFGMVASARPGQRLPQRRQPVVGQARRRLPEHPQEVFDPRRRRWETDVRLV